MTPFSLIEVHRLVLLAGLASPANAGEPYDDNLIVVDEHKSEDGLVIDERESQRGRFHSAAGCETPPHTVCEEERVDLGTGWHQELVAELAFWVSFERRRDERRFRREMRSAGFRVDRIMDTTTGSKRARRRRRARVRTLVVSTYTPSDSDAIQNAVDTVEEAAKVHHARVPPNSASSATRAVSWTPLR